MQNRIFKNIFSLSGLSISIGVLGFISGIVQLFIDINYCISIKWVLLLLLLLGSIILILLKTIHDLNLENNLENNLAEVPVNFITNNQNENIFIIRKNKNFLNNMIVSGYFRNNEIDDLLFMGYVSIIQEKLIQIQVIKWLSHPDIFDDSGNIRIGVIPLIEVRTTIPLKFMFSQ